MRFILLLTTSFSTVYMAVADADVLVERGQRAFELGQFSQASADWQKAIETFRKEGKTKAEVETSVYLASACQAIGQQRRAVEILEGALERAKKAGDDSLEAQVHRSALPDQKALAFPHRPQSPAVPDHGRRQSPSTL